MLTRPLHLLCLSLGIWGAACGGPDAPVFATDGVAALTTVPTGVACVRVTVTRDGRATTRGFDVASAGAATFDLGPANAAALTATGKAYDVACTAVTGAVAATWQSELVSAEVVAGQPVRLALHFTKVEPLAVDADFADGVADVTMGGGATFAVMRNGTVRAWGYNYGGNLGTGSASPSIVTSPVAIPALNKVVQVAAGQWHACALLETGAIRCWGDNAQAQLGQDAGRGAGSLTPLPLGAWAAGMKFRRIAAANSTTCAVTDNGALWCWGNPDEGLLGVTGASDEVRRQVYSEVLDVVVTAYAACLRKFDGRVLCWGDYAPRCDGSTSSSGPTPTFTSMPPVRQLALANGTLVATAVERGNLMTCGANMYGVLGTGEASSVWAYEPRVVRAGIAAVGAGVTHACAVDDAGAVLCWGRNAEGELGLGDPNARFTPTVVDVGGLAQKVVADYQSTCALLRDGSLRCWGVNNAGQLGDGTYEYRYAPVRPRL